MTRQEYLNQKTDEVAPVSGAIKDLSEYIEIRKQCDQFERGDITAFLTEDDYKAFDTNFNKCLESLQYKDPDYEEVKSDIERVQEMMELTDWKWAYSGEDGKDAVPSKQQIIECIRYCYEQSLESGHARGGCGTGGVNVETDIVDHTVSITFEYFEITHYDGDE